MVLSQHLPKKEGWTCPNQKIWFQLPAELYDLGQVLLPLFFFFPHFHNYKNESWPRSGDKFYLWPSPRDWRSYLQRCVGRISRGIQLSRKEGHDLLPLAQVQEDGWGHVRYLLHMDEMLSFFFFFFNIYLFLTASSLSCNIKHPS